MTILLDNMLSVKHNGHYEQADYRSTLAGHQVLGRRELDPLDCQDHWGR